MVPLPPLPCPLPCAAPEPPQGLCPLSAAPPPLPALWAPDHTAVSGFTGAPPQGLPPRRSHMLLTVHHSRGPRGQALRSGLSGPHCPGQGSSPAGKGLGAGQPWAAAHCGGAHPSSQEPLGPPDLPGPAGVTTPPAWAGFPLQPQDPLLPLITSRSPSSMVLTASSAPTPAAPPRPPLRPPRPPQAPASPPHYY